jgi:hypothetical protein
MRRILLTALTCGALSACFNPFFFLPPLKEGKHYVQPTTQTDIDRGKDVAACLQRWARANGHPDADYSDIDYSKLVIVGVGDPGVIGVEWNARGDTIATYEVAGREQGDSIFVSLRTIRNAHGTFVAISRHEDLHIAQEHHRELVGANGDIHWSPPFNYCQIPIVVWTQ